MPGTAYKEKEMHKFTPKRVEKLKDMTVEEAIEQNRKLLLKSTKNEVLVKPEILKKIPPLNINFATLEYPIDVKPMAIIQINQGEKHLLYEGSEIELKDGGKIACVGVMPGYTLNSSVAMFEVTKPGYQGKERILLSNQDGEYNSLGYNIALKDLTLPQSKGKTTSMYVEMVNRNDEVIDAFVLKPGESKMSNGYEIYSGKQYAGYTLRDNSAEITALIAPGKSAAYGTINIGEALDLGDVRVRLADLEAPSSSKQANLEFVKTTGSVYHGFIGENQSGLALVEGIESTPITNGFEVKIGKAFGGYTLAKKAVFDIEVGGSKVSELHIGEEATINGMKVRFKDIAFVP